MAVPTRNPMRASRRGRRLRTEALEPRRLLAADPIITEFAATNSGVLLDGFGASPDWVEVFNRGDASLDLAGYSLTDDADETDKWVFPQTTLEPGEYLVVFASGLDTTDPGGHLHTNFGLSAEGDYIALANPSGVVLSEFGAGGQDYPLQATNDTFGLEFDSETTQVVSPGSAAQHLVPSGPAVDATWTSPSFDDSTWSAGTASLGNEAEPGLYEDLIDTVLPGGTRSAYVRIPFHIGEADAKLGSLRLRFDDGFVAYLNGSPIADFNAPEHVGYDSRATEFRPREAAVEEAAFYVGDHSDLLVVGENVLAIHLLDAVDSPSEDLLLTAELTVASGHPIAPAAGPLMAATPGHPTRSYARATCRSRAAAGSSRVRSHSRSRPAWARPSATRSTGASQTQVRRFTRGRSRSTRPPG